MTLHENAANNRINGANSGQVEIDPLPPRTKQLTLNLNDERAPKRIQEHHPTESIDYALGKSTMAHQDAHNSKGNNYLD
jgi:hypothetical protein